MFNSFNQTVWIAIKARLPLIGIIVSLLGFSWNAYRNLKDMADFTLTFFGVFGLLILVSCGMFISSGYARCAQLEKQNDRLNKSIISLSKDLCEASFNNIRLLQNALHRNVLLEIRYRQEETNLQCILSQVRDIARSEDEEAIERIDDKVKGTLKRTRSYYYNALTDNTRRCFRNLTEHTKKALESYLHSQNINAKLSLSIQQLTDVFPWGSQVFDDFFAFTIFRDGETYNENLREIGTKHYSIAGNTAFSSVLNQSHLLKAYYGNNSLEKSYHGFDQFATEDVNFLKFYDAIVVVPITDCLPSGKRVVYGFLTCDTKKPSDHLNDKVFDDAIVKFLFSTGLLLGIYLTNSVEVWRKITKDDNRFNDLLRIEMPSKPAKRSTFSNFGYAIAREIPFDSEAELKNP